MIWKGFPVVRYLLLAAALTGPYVVGIVKLVRWYLPNDTEWRSGRGLTGVVGLTAATALLVLAARGGWQRKPLQWGDAVHSKSVFANHLAQNGFWMLAKDLFGGTGHSGDSEGLRHIMPTNEAHDRARRLLLLPQEELAGDHDCYPLLRTSRGGYRTVSLPPVSQDPPNVVVIMMESFSARFVGAVGSDNDHTPEYNRLAQRGILFDRCFSNGTRTHQAHYTIMAGFPNLPTTEWLMQNKLGDQPFDSLPRALKQRGYHTIYFHNGHMDWDNVEGFYKFQGVERFIGLRDFDTKANFVGTWGVLDNVLFERANQEFAKVKGPFYATIMTATNHVPFECPRPLPFPEVTVAGKSTRDPIRFPRNAGHYGDRLNGVRYSDWSLGKFFELARKEAYFRNTLFVVVGDHGINSPPVLTELNLLHHHVPLLFYAPSLLGEEPQRIHTVASHLDIAPTILGLLGDTGPHQHWGRDLFSLPDGDEGFAVIKSTAQPELGLVRGDTVLVRPGAGKFRLYRYDFGFPPSVVELGSSESDLAEAMDRDLRAYIQTATEVLTDRHAAP
jgi:phosphoglycerol transferase MdoB-like AlkP superfamily enzyme